MIKTLRNFNAALLLFILLTGCLPLTLFQKPSAEDVSFAPQKLNSADFAKETKKLILITQTPATSTIEKAEAHRRLAILYLNLRNPDRNFQKSIDELGNFLESAPEKLGHTAATSWATALKSGKEYQSMEKNYLSLKNRIAKLDKKNRQLAKENKNLTNTNDDLKQIIEKLKLLDLSLEKKRRNFR